MLMVIQLSQNLLWRVLIAPVVIPVLADKSIPTYVYDDSLVLGNMMLAAHSLGLGSCWIHRANYKCTSMCRHCCYSCSPKWPDDYMTSAVADEVFYILRSLGCYHVHIGGGEPLIKPDKILDVLDAARKNNIEIEYIETNSSWYRDETSTNAILKELKDHGVNTLLISIDPFHNEYIPF